MKKKIINLLNSLNVKNGDSIMIHGDASFISQYSKNKPIKDLNYFFDLLCKKVGFKGEVLCPAFTYSFCKKKIFEPKKSKSEVGLFSEIFRKRKDTFRTIHPIFSFSIYSKNNNYKDASPNTCFGFNSIFEKFLKKKGKIFIFGPLFEDSCTFLHYLEEIAKISYRYKKKFNGKIIFGSKKYNTYTIFFVRKKKIKNTIFKMNKSLSKIISKKKFGRYYVIYVSSKKITKHILAKLKYNDRYLVNG